MSLANARTTAQDGFSTRSTKRARISSYDLPSFEIAMWKMFNRERWNACSTGDGTHSGGCPLRPSYSSSLHMISWRTHAGCPERIWSLMDSSRRVNSMPLLSGSWLKEAAPAPGTPAGQVIKPDRCRWRLYHQGGPCLTPADPSADRCRDRCPLIVPWGFLKKKGSPFRTSPDSDFSIDTPQRLIRWTHGTFSDSSGNRRNRVCDSEHLN